jgi:hypothetical protein
MAHHLSFKSVAEFASTQLFPFTKTRRILANSARNGFMADPVVAIYVPSS